MTDGFELLGGALLLYLGAEWFVGGAASLALALRVPRMLVGLTVVAYGTSIPEVIVGMQAAASGHGEVALGNVVGSNIANIGLILGVAILVRPPRVDASLGRRQVPVLVGSTALLPLLLIDDVIGPWEATGLVLGSIGYTAWMVRSARTASDLLAATVDAKVTEEAADLAGAPSPSSVPRAAIASVVGLLILLVGGHLFVGGAVTVARALGISDRLVGLTLVAVGTSLPELVTSILAARRGHTDLALGNVVGSNIFNTSLGLGAAALAGSVAAPIRSLELDLAALLGMTVLAAVLLGRERRVTRAEGAMALGLYVVITVAMSLRG